MPQGSAYDIGAYEYAPPSIASFTPANAPVGTLVTINGGGFFGVTAVKFNGIGANFVVNSGNQITGIVPNTTTSGPISITTGGTATSAGVFTVTSSNAPAISGFAPAAGTPGTNVMLAGSNFTGVVAARQSASPLTQRRKSQPSFLPPL
jgi:hypothetical protein